MTTMTPRPEVIPPTLVEASVCRKRSQGQLSYFLSIPTRPRPMHLNVETNTPSPAVNELLATLPPPPALWRLTLLQVTGIIYFGFRKARTVVGTMEECEALYQKVLTHNLLAGWWSIFGLIWNIGALSQNRKSLKTIRDLEAEGRRAPDWHPDPTGRHAERYWDGSSWTDQVRSQASDPVLDPVGEVH